MPAAPTCPAFPPAGGGLGDLLALTSELGLEAPAGTQAVLCPEVLECQAEAAALRESLQRDLAEIAASREAGPAQAPCPVRGTASAADTGSDAAASCGARHNSSEALGVSGHFGTQAATPQTLLGDVSSGTKDNDRGKAASLELQATPVTSGDAEDVCEDLQSPALGAAEGDLQAESARATMRLQVAGQEHMELQRQHDSQSPEQLPARLEDKSEEQEKGQPEWQAGGPSGRSADSPTETPDSQEEGSEVTLGDGLGGSLPERPERRLEEGVEDWRPEETKTDRECDRLTVMPEDGQSQQPQGRQDDEREGMAEHTGDQTVKTEEDSQEDIEEHGKEDGQAHREAGQEPTWGSDGELRLVEEAEGKGARDSEEASLLVDAEAHGGRDSEEERGLVDEEDHGGPGLKPNQLHEQHARLDAATAEEECSAADATDAHTANSVEAVEHSFARHHTREDSCLKQGDVEAERLSAEVSQAAVTQWAEEIAQVRSEEEQVRGRLEDQAEAYRQGMSAAVEEIAQVRSEEEQVRGKLEDQAEAYRQGMSAAVEEMARGLESVAQMKTETERAMGRAEGAERELERLVVAMEDMTHRLEEEEMRRGEVEQTCERVEDACRAACKHWEEASTFESREAAVQRAGAEQAWRSAIESRQRMEEALADREEEIVRKQAEEKQRWLALEAWQAADDAKTELQLRLQQLEQEQCWRAEEADARRAELAGELARWRSEAERASAQRREDAALHQEARASLARAEQEAASHEEAAAFCRLEVESRRSCQLLGWCSSRSSRRGLDEAQELHSELRRRTEEAEARQADASRRAEDETLARRRLEAARSELRSEEEVFAARALETATRRLRHERDEEEAVVRRNAEVAQGRLYEEEAAARRRRERAVHPAGAQLSNIPLAVRIPCFEVKKEGLTATRIIYSIIVEGPGTTECFTRQFAEFRELHELLSTKPFASLLQSRPQDWFFAHLSTTMLERQRRQLEAYLAFLCAHSHVLLDTAIWRWLDVDDLTQVVVRLVAASRVHWAAEVSRLVQTLEAVVAAEGSESRCIHPSVLGVLKEVLLDPGDEAARAAAGRLLSRLLAGSRRARELFLAPEAGGTSALISLLRPGGDESCEAAAEALRRALEAMVVAEAEGRRHMEEERARQERADAEEQQSQLTVENAKEPSECCVCLDRGKSHALLPCGHLCACMDCAAFLAARGSPCPVCRCSIERAVQIFT